MNITNTFSYNRLQHVTSISWQQVFCNIMRQCYTFQDSKFMKPFNHLLLYVGITLWARLSISWDKTGPGVGLWKLILCTLISSCYRDLYICRWVSQYVVIYTLCNPMNCYSLWRLRRDFFYLQIYNSVFYKAKKMDSIP